MDDAIYANDDVIFSDSVRKSGNRNSYGRGHPGFPPGAAPSVSRRFQVLLAVLCVTLICVLGTIGVLCKYHVLLQLYL
ncbi:hypothetical protein UPYG_G00355310 [Umbra pygmaea]|uniref:Uncharacterized protein n=1 Tax=Umbra pygmaea TaxID=75934 RepID=A0ABD0VWW2_UMBPY